MKVREISDAHVEAYCQGLADKIRETKGPAYIGIYPILRGGYYPAVILSRILKIPLLSVAGKNILVVDDIVDSGRTLEQYTKAGYDTAVLVDKCLKKAGDVLGEERATFHGITAPIGEWIEFPWEDTSYDHKAIVVRQIEAIGEDPNRPGLIDTPDRVTRMWKELFRGYDKDQMPKVTAFKNGVDGITYDQMIVDGGDFYSQCEHHMVPFFGKYWFAYIPAKNGLVVGLSKIARVVDYYSARLQIQERLVNDVVTHIQKALDEENPPLGIAMVMEGEHLCKTMRGAKKKGRMITSSITGVFRDDPAAKAEFMNFVNNTRYV